VSLGKALHGIASTFELFRLVVTGGSLTRKPKKSLRCLLVEVPWQINEYLNLMDWFRRGERGRIIFQKGFAPLAPGWLRPYWALCINGKSTLLSYLLREFRPSTGAIVNAKIEHWCKKTLHAVSSSLKWKLSIGNNINYQYNRLHYSLVLFCRLSICLYFFTTGIEFPTLPRLDLRRSNFFSNLGYISCSVLYGVMFSYISVWIFANWQ